MTRRAIVLLRRVCGCVLPVVAARLCVSAGRWIYATHTGQQVFGDDPVPPLHTLIFGDVFFYLGLAAALAYIGCSFLLRHAKTQSRETCE